MQIYMITLFLGRINKNIYLLIYIYYIYIFDLLVSYFKKHTRLPMLTNNPYSIYK